MYITPGSFGNSNPHPQLYETLRMRQEENAPATVFHPIPSRSSRAYSLLGLALGFTIGLFSLALAPSGGFLCLALQLLGLRFGRTCRRASGFFDLSGCFLCVMVSTCLLSQRGKGEDIRPFSMPFTAAPEKALSAFFSVSLVASMGPFSIRAVEEIDRFRPMDREGVEVRAARRAATGVKRIREEDIVIVIVIVMSLDGITQNKLGNAID